MDIRVGGVGAIGPASSKTVEARGPIEARVLSLRRPRAKSGRRPVNLAERRENQTQSDPEEGCVLVLMIPDAKQLPVGLRRGQYRVFLRLVRR